MLSIIRRLFQGTTIEPIIAKTLQFHPIALPSKMDQEIDLPIAGGKFWVDNPVLTAQKELKIEVKIEMIDRFVDA